MSIMSQLLESKFIFFIFILIGLFAAPLLVLVPLAVIVLCWNAITMFAEPSLQDFFHFLLIDTVVIVFLFISGLYSKVNNWIIKKYWINTRWYEPPFDDK